MKIIFDGFGFYFTTMWAKRNQSGVQAADDHAFFFGVQSWAKYDFVDGDGRLNGHFMFQVTAEDGSAYGRPQEPISHFVGVGFPASFRCESEVVRRKVVVVAVVLGLDDFDEFFAALEKVWFGCEPWLALQDVFGKRVDVVQCFEFTGDGFFHDLVGGEVGAIGLLVDGAVDDVGAVEVQLELTHNGFVQVSLPVGHAGRDDDVMDQTFVEQDGYFVLIEFHLFPCQGGVGNLAFPTLWHLLVDIGVLHVIEFYDSGIFEVGDDGKSGF